MNISSLIQGFSSYLENLNETSEKNYNTSSSNVSIFMYSSEFKSYIADELDIADSSIFSKSINDILSMDVVNGKLVENKDENTDSFETSEDNETDETNSIQPEENIPNQNETPAAENTNSGEIAQEGGEEGTEVLTDLLNNLFQDESVISALDTDNSGELDKEEISSFIETINGADGDANNLTLDDILAGIEQIKEKANETETAEEETEPETEEINQAQNVAASTGTPASSSGSFSGGSTGGSSIPSSSSNNSVQEKTLDNMTREELNSELSTAESDLTEKQGALSALYDGSDSNLQALNENMENLYDTYLEELETVDEEMAEQVDTLKQDIDSKQDEIDAKDQEIADQEGVVSNAEAAYNNAVSNTQQLKSSLSSLQSTDTSNMDDSQIAELNSKIAELQSKVTEAEQAEDDAKQAWDDAEDALDTLNEQRDSLQTELDNLNNDMTELEAEIVEKYPEIQESLNAYNEAKQEHDNYKSEAITSTKSEIESAQNYVNEINTAINNLDNKEIEKEYSMNQYDAEEGERLVDVAKQMLGRYGSSTGYCATGVSRTMSMAYGISMGGNGCDWDTNMDKLVAEGMFTEVTSDYPTSGDLSSLPAGAVVCWEATGGTNGGGAQYGHVTIADGNGGEISDHYASNIYTSVGGRSDTYRIFIPV